LRPITRGGERLRGPNIVLSQPWMIGQDRLGRHASVEFAQDQLYRECAFPQMTGLPYMISGLASMRS
jgi:hypothetical protein